MKKKYFFFDIDGTLTVNLPEKHISYVPDSTKETLKQLKAAGHFVSIATGRAHWMAEEIMSLVDIDNLVTNGGNGIVLGGRLVELLPLDHEKAIHICETFYNDGRGVGVMLFDDNRLFCKDRRFPDEHPGFNGFLNYIVDEQLDFRKEKNIYKILVSLNKEDESLYPCLKTLPYMRYHPGNIMFEPDDKFSGIRRVMDVLKAPIEDVVVFGDGRNDIDMFSKAPFCIAMGNSVEELKVMADFVTKNVEEDGIAYACRHFNWI